MNELLDIPLGFIGAPEYANLGPPPIGQCVDPYRLSTWALLAPGPTATAEQASAVTAVGLQLGAIGNAYELAPDAAFIASTDSKWWRLHPQAKERTCDKYAMHNVAGTKRVRIDGFPTAVNSGVLGLEVAKRKGAARILLIGFDMHGTHFFGRYTNGCTNTNPNHRRLHFRQYEQWAKANRDIEVINCTDGSALQTFPMARLDDCLHHDFRQDAPAVAAT